MTKKAKGLQGVPGQPKNGFGLPPDVRTALLHPEWLDRQPWYRPLMPVAEHVASIVILAKRARGNEQRVRTANQTMLEMWEHLAQAALAKRDPNRAYVLARLSKILEDLREGSGLSILPEQRAKLVRNGLGQARDALTCPAWHHTPWAQELLALTAKGITLNNGNQRLWKQLRDLMGGQQQPKAADILNILNALHTAMDHQRVEVMPHNLTGMFAKGMRAARTALQQAA